ncbi:MAG: Dephospho-CoA kinase [Bacteroidota bacterium]
MLFQIFFLNKMKTKIIGLTGGIGSGKTTIARIFESQGFPVYISDDRAKLLMKEPSTINAITAAFGNTILTGQILDKKKLAKIVFNNSENLKTLNAIIHPLVAIDFELWLKQYLDCDFVIKESAILFETGSNEHCYKVISVVAPIAVRIERVIKRDNVTKEAVILRIDKQISDDARCLQSDFVIQNNDINLMKNQVYQIIKQLRYDKNAIKS